MPSTSKMFQTTNQTQMTQSVASFRTTTPSTAMTGTMTTKQVNPVHVHQDTSCKAPLGHCAHVHKSTIQVCKPGESLALRKVKHPHNRRTSVNIRRYTIKCLPNPARFMTETVPAPVQFKYSAQYI